MKPTQEEIENLNRSMRSKGIKIVTKYLPFHIKMLSAMHFIQHSNNTNHSQTQPERK